MFGNASNVTVEVTIMGRGRGRSATLRDGATVADALREAFGEDAKGCQFSINDREVSATSPVRNGDEILVTKMIKGN